MDSVTRVIVACALVLTAGTAFADITSVALGDNTGEDWEPAILADGAHVYALWPHMPTALHDSSGAICMPYSNKGGGNNRTTFSYMYFQSSSNGGSSWSTVSIPRCPVNGNVVDAQLALGINHRIYAGYMDGNAQYTPIMVIYSDDFGATLSTPVDVTAGRRRWDIVLVDGNNNVMGVQNGGKQYVSVSIVVGRSRRGR
jgi:hypothetical protein